MVVRLTNWKGPRHERRPPRCSAPGSRCTRRGTRCSSQQAWRAQRWETPWPSSRSRRPTTQSTTASRGSWAERPPRKSAPNSKTEIDSGRKFSHDIKKGYSHVPISRNSFSEQYCDFKTSTNDSNNLQLTNNPLLLQQGNFSTRYYFCSKNKEKTFNLFKLFSITLNIFKKRR